MSETLSDQKVPADLSGRRIPPPSELVDALGYEKAQKLEDLSELVADYHELICVTDPFERAGGQKPAFGDELRAAISGVDNLKRDILDKPPAEINAAARLYSPVLAKSAKAYSKRLVKTLEEAARVIIDSRSAIDRLDAQDHDLTRDELAKAYEALGVAADSLPAEGEIFDLKLILDAEADAAYWDKVAIGVVRKPELWAQYEKYFEKDTAELMLYRKERAHILGILREAGGKNWRLRRSHRSGSANYADVLYAKSTHEFYKKQKANGSKVIEEIKTVAAEAVADPAWELFQTLCQSKGSDYQRLIDQIDAGHKDLTPVALCTEDYLAQKAASLETVFRRADIRFNPTGRRLMHELKETKLKDRLRRLGSEAVRMEPDPHKNVPVDGAFRRQCRELRDILVGGSRLDHPEARTLAIQLHRLSFNGEHQSLLPAESGLIVGIVADKVRLIIATVKRFEAASAVEDPQIEKLRRERPDQFTTISRFDLREALAKLRAIIADRHNMVALLSVVPAEKSSELLTFIEESAESDT